MTADLTEFKKSLDKNLCPFCNRKFKFYNGAMGRLAYECHECGIEIDQDGLHLDVRA